MNIEGLIISLYFEEDNRESEKKGIHNLNEAKANFVEHGLRFQVQESQQ